MNPHDNSTCYHAAGDPCPAQQGNDYARGFADSATKATGEQQGDKLPDTLTLQPCNCGHETCQRVGFREGLFYQGAGFDRALAEEVKRRYDAGAQPRGLARLDAGSVAAICEIIADVIDDGKPYKAEGARPDAALPWSFYPANQFWRNETPQTNADRLDFIAEVRKRIWQHAAPATNGGKR